MNSFACQEFARSNKKYSWVGVQGLHMPPHKLAYTDQFQGCVVVYGEYVVSIDPGNRFKHLDGNYGRSVCTTSSRTTTRISSTKPAWPTYYSKDICNCCKLGGVLHVYFCRGTRVRARGKCTGAVGPTAKDGMVCAATPTPTPSRGTTFPPPTPRPVHHTISNKVANIWIRDVFPALVLGAKHVSNLA